MRQGDQLCLIRFVTGRPPYRNRFINFSFFFTKKSCKRLENLKVCDTFRPRCGRARGHAQHFPEAESNFSGDDDNPSKEHTYTNNHVAEDQSD